MTRQVENCPNCHFNLVPVEEEKWTSIRIKKSTQDVIEKYREYPANNIDDVLNKILNNDHEVYVRIIAVNDESVETSKSTVYFQLGDNPPRYYVSANGENVALPEPLKMTVSKAKKKSK